MPPARAEGFDASGSTTPVSKACLRALVAGAEIFCPDVDGRFPVRDGRWIQVAACRVALYENLEAAGPRTFTCRQARPSSNFGCQVDVVSAHQE